MDVWTLSEQLLLHIGEKVGEIGFKCMCGDEVVEYFYYSNLMSCEFQRNRIFFSL